jgi:hypothetical protein
VTHFPVHSFLKGINRASGLAQAKKESLALPPQIKFQPHLGRNPFFELRFDLSRSPGATF